MEFNTGLLLRGGFIVTELKIRKERSANGPRLRRRDWKVESVLIKKSVGEEKAEEQAREIVDKIES